MPLLLSIRFLLRYGPGVKGNMAQLMRLARSPFPLPVGSLGARRSLLALENLLAAIEIVLAVPGTLRRAFIAADPQALTVAEMIAAMRHGLGRRPNVFPLPVALLQLLLRAAGREEIYQRLSGSLVADPSALISLGWKPPLATGWTRQVDAGKRGVKTRTSGLLTARRKADYGRSCCGRSSVARGHPLLRGAPASC
jgi:UDP-glucose 4-epimerase